MKLTNLFIQVNGMTLDCINLDLSKSSKQLHGSVLVDGTYNNVAVSFPSGWKKTEEPDLYILGHPDEASTLYCIEPSPQ